MQRGESVLLQIQTLNRVTSVCGGDPFCPLDDAKPSSDFTGHKQSPKLSCANHKLVFCSELAATGCNRDIVVDSFLFLFPNGSLQHSVDKRNSMLLFCFNESCWFLAGVYISFCVLAYSLGYRCHLHTTFSFCPLLRLCAPMGRQSKPTLN